MSSYYSDYADHMLRFYCRYPDKQAQWGMAEKSNWTACHDVLRGLSEDDTNIITNIYKNASRSLSEAVNGTSMRMGFSPSYAWKLIWSVRKAVAERRNLL